MTYFDQAFKHFICMVICYATLYFVTYDPNNCFHIHVKEIIHLDTGFGSDNGKAIWNQDQRRWNQADFESDFDCLTETLENH